MKNILRTHGPAWRAVAIAVVCAGAAAPQEAPRLEATRIDLEKWIETQRVIAKERADWRLGREMLTSRTALVEQEIASLRERIEESRRSLAEADTKRDELLAARAELERTAGALTAAITTVEDRVRELLPRLPTPLAELLRPLARALPAAGSETELGLGQRFQNTIGILDQVEKFHREMTLSPEVRELEDGRSVEVTVLYAGIAQGWFATPDGATAGVGMPRADGWDWSTAKGAAPSIRAAVEIVGNERPAAFVPLPVRVQ